MYNNRNQTVAGAVGNNIRPGMGGANALRNLSGGANQQGRADMSRYTGPEARPQGGSFTNPGPAPTNLTAPPVNGGGLQAGSGRYATDGSPMGTGVWNPPQNYYQSPLTTDVGNHTDPNWNYQPPPQRGAPQNGGGFMPPPGNGADALRQMREGGPGFGRGRGLALGRNGGLALGRDHGRGRPTSGLEALRERMRTRQPIDNGGAVFNDPTNGGGFRSPPVSPPVDGGGYLAPLKTGGGYIAPPRLPPKTGGGYIAPDPRYLGPPAQMPPRETTPIRNITPAPYAPSYRSDPWI